MEKTVEVLFSEDLLQSFLLAFNLEKEHKKLGDFENYVFEVYRDSQPYILRLTHSTHRSKEQIASELDWMNYLHNQGISVPKAYASINERFVEEKVVEDGSSFYACLFSKAEGDPIKVGSDRFKEDLFFAWGKVIGEMHLATRNYQPSNQIMKRPSWDEEGLLEIEKYISVSEDKIIKNTKELLIEMKSLPMTNENFGLIHTDVHSGNFFYDGEKVHVFDFDDCCYKWFASDIAIPLYYSVFYNFELKTKEARNEFASLYIKAFMNGYKSICEPPKDWELQLPLFLRLRDIVLYAVFHKKIAPEDRSEKLVSLMKDIKERIENNESIVTI